MNTLLLMVLVPTLIVMICAAISWIVTRSRLRWRVAFDAIAFLPHPVPNLLFALAIAYFALLISNVVPVYGTIYVIMAVYVVCWMSFGTRVLNNSMIQVHRELEEAAQVGGVSTFRILAKVIVPLIQARARLYVDLDFAVGVSRVDHGGISRLAQEPGAFHLYLGAWHGGGLGDAAAIAIMMIAVMSPVVTFWIYARKQQQVASST